MVQLQFTVCVEGDFEEVWKFFSDFANLPKWDPGIKEVKMLREGKNQVGVTFGVTSVLKGKESQLEYTSREHRKDGKEGYISFEGGNGDISTFDEIICRRTGDKKTEVVYRADICLRGWKWLFTPLITSTLNQIGEEARAGCRDKARELWGHAS